MPVTANPAVRRVLALMAATAVTGVGSGLFLLTGPWLMYNITHSAFWVGVLSAMAGLMFWAGPPLAHLVDRYDRRHVQLLALAVQALTALGLGIVVARGATTVPVVLAAELLLGAGSNLGQLANASILSTLIPPQARLTLNSWWSVATLLVRYGAPGLAGFVLAAGGVPLALYLQAAAAIPLAAASLLLPRHVIRHAPDEALGTLRQAWSVLRSARGLWLSTWAMAYWNWTFAGLLALLVYFYRSDLHFTATQAGLAGLAAGVPPIGFALLGPWLNRRWGPGRVLVGSIALSGVAMATLPALSGPAWVGGAVGMADGPIGPVLAGLTTMMQHRIPTHQYARVTALRRMVSMGATPTASVLAGWAAGQVGAPPVLAGFGVLTVLGAGWAAWRGALARVTLLGDIGPRVPAPSAGGMGGDPAG